ncbi:DUF1329 domain-containing protein [Endozoicomonas sp. GU-1]|uniref:DUF1329 domain-containing protein n=1 Tax=Endozoicomonas sp. GU-1 TaxID=3009078 RepID=UPI0022B5C758|nr:DUF1329 domain-containing protein [Endozoicomonas sp. GU-1]WBA80304.1 DUF1329 domain-containing protein [Endozoicomonas sp. GU-1]WBA87875.1 DUF1329 domain-containing protein [Endozoicomonas sp. GU-1]
MKTRPLFSTLAIAVGITFSSLSLAAVDNMEAKRLTSELTPFGAERAGNKEGTIPAWTGKLVSVDNGYDPERVTRADPFADEKPLFEITAENYKEHQDKLSTGIIAMLEAYPDTFRIPVYKTHRTFTAPERVVNNTLNNATSAQLANDGNGFSGAIAGIPFPIPQNANEIIWNHITRWQGINVEGVNEAALVQPSGQVKREVSKYDAYFKYYDPNVTAEELDNTLFFYLREQITPVRDAGELTLVKETVDQVAEPRKAWIYLPGQRRVKKAPTTAYDTPTGFILTDEVDLYNGSPDRFDWQIVGKQEMYIPYNSYALASKDLSSETLLTPHHLNPDYTRWELHRVWVIEGNLKEGNRHIYSKRRMYLDEDSWAGAIMEAYDSRGGLWKVNTAHLKMAYEIPSMMSSPTVYHDLANATYSVSNMENGDVGMRNILAEQKPLSFWKSANLRRLGKR